ncbi:MAG TPA: hypothetical protein VFC99_19275 [Acidimicrobiia bacterium]|nr:hypothetical protein [Acidimicrobiia bacterium]
MPQQPDEELTPESPEAAGIRPRTERIEDVEPERLLENEIRGRLEADGFTDQQILKWVEAYFAEHTEGEPDEVVAWIREKEKESGTL